jgi:hypothetical protein
VRETALTRPFADVVQDLVPELRSHLRHVFPDVPADVPLAFFPVGGHTSHYALVVEGRTSPPRRLFLKGPLRPGVPRLQSDAVERRLLAEIGPRISAANPATRCPRLIAALPERECLVLELVPGPTLDALLFGFRPTAVQGLPRLIHLAGEWLGRFHGLTRSGEGRPFVWLLDALRRPPAGSSLARALGTRAYARLLRLAEGAAERHANLVRPRSLVHDNFAPSQVLVQGDGVCVIDLAHSRPGFGYEDVGHFLALCDLRFPWRRAVAARRLRHATLARQLVNGYRAAGVPFDTADAIAIAFARVVAAAALVRHLQGNETRARALRSRLARPWLERRLRLACRRALASLAETDEMGVWT